MLDSNPGTLADLKKHRAQSRFTQNGAIPSNGNGSLTPSEVIAAATANGGGSIVTATTTATANAMTDEMDGNSNKIPIELSLISAEDHYQSHQHLSNGGSSSNNNNMVGNNNNNNNNNGGVSLSNGSTKFSGIITGDVVSDSTRSKRCCVVM